jgi:competence protein ComEC
VEPRQRLLVEARSCVAPADGPLASQRHAAAILHGTKPLAPTSALLAGFLLGDRAIPQPVSDDYRASGLSHLLAVSGANVAFVLVVFAPLLGRLRLVPRTATAIAIVGCFAAATRFEPSVLRASALTTITILATFVGRPVAPLRALALAIMALLLVDPFLLHSLGFHLSCAASAGIAVLAHPLAARLKGPQMVREPLAVSIAAQVGVTPVLLAAFGSVPVITPVANLLAYPAAEALGVFGLAASVVGGVVPPVGTALAPITEALLAWVTAVAHATAGLGGEIDVAGALAVGATLGVAITARRPVARGRPRDRARRAVLMDGPFA